MSITLERLTKTYDGHAVVRDVSLEIGDGELFVLLGPSGSGKSTVLRIVAGLTEPDAGRVRLHARDVTETAPQKRGVGLVFQHYALFRHMTVAENVEFALRVRRVRGRERRRRREELLDLVGLGGLAARMPHQLSGGQQQRVALARALAHRPEVLLLDEPFGALDARIRSELRRTFRAIQRELGVTTLFVTHDQEEAFELADRLGVMHFGRLLEVGPPQELYLRPQTEFVATFLGKANLLVGEASSNGVRLGGVTIQLATEPAAAVSRRVQVLFRPEDVAVKVTSDALGWPALGRASVESTEFVGSQERLRLRLPALPGVRSIAPASPFGDAWFVVEASRSQHLARRFPLSSGEEAWIGLRRIHALPHPGMRFAVVDDGGAASLEVAAFAGNLARLAHARVLILLCAGGNRGPLFRERLGPGLPEIDTLAWDGEAWDGVFRAAADADADLIVAPSAEARRGGADAVLRGCGCPVLLAQPGSVVPRTMLICVAVGEPGRSDVLFAGRLARHLGAEGTVFHALVDGEDEIERRRAEAFLDASVRTLDRLGVRARGEVGTGPASAAILDRIGRGGFDLVVVGRPGESNAILAGDRVAGSVLKRGLRVPVLIVAGSQEEAA